MSLGGGRFGPAFKTEHTEKVWKGKREWWAKKYLQTGDSLIHWDLEDCSYSKFYSAEYIE